MTTTHWILFAAFLAAHALGFVVAMCYAAKRGDEIMTEVLSKSRHQS